MILTETIQCSALFPRAEQGLLNAAAGVPHVCTGLSWLSASAGLSRSPWAQLCVLGNTVLETLSSVFACQFLHVQLISLVWKEERCGRFESILFSPVMCPVSTCINRLENVKRRRALLGLAGEHLNEGLSSWVCRNPCCSSPACRHTQ